MGISAHGYILTDFLGRPSTSQAAQYPIPEVRICRPESVEGDCLAGEPNNRAPSLPCRPPPPNHTHTAQEVLPAARLRPTALPRLNPSGEASGAAQGLAPDTPGTSCLSQGGSTSKPLILGTCLQTRDSKGDSLTYLGISPSMRS